MGASFVAQIRERVPGAEARCGRCWMSGLKPGPISEARANLRSKSKSQEQEQISEARAKARVVEVKASGGLGGWRVLGPSTAALA